MAANISCLRTDHQASLNPLMALVASDMREVNDVILENMQSEIPLIPKIARHLIAGGGKRIRPMLMLAAIGLFDYTGQKHCKLAAAIEFIHTATLLHDDVVDSSDLRRGGKTANIIWGNGASVLVGDFLFSRAFELMVEGGSLKVLKILSRAAAVIAEGEVNQLSLQRCVETTENQYLEIVRAKTAELFAASCRVAAIVAQADKIGEMALECYGRNLGIAFQLVDDTIDYVSDSTTMGKGVGDDFRDGKLTLPVILAYARGTQDEREFWRSAMSGHCSSDKDLLHANHLLENYGAIDDTLARARQYGQNAIDALDIFLAGPARTALIETVRFSVTRTY